MKMHLETDRAASRRNRCKIDVKSITRCNRIKGGGNVRLGTGRTLLPMLAPLKCVAAIEPKARVSVFYKLNNIIKNRLLEKKKANAKTYMFRAFA